MPASGFPFDAVAAAITGAASGIGRALALELAARGCDLALADVDPQALDVVAAQVRERYRRQVFAQQVDVSQRPQIEAFALAAQQQLPHLAILINNAGVALQGDFSEVEPAQIEWLMGVNFWGVVYGTHAFLPLLARRPLAHIVNLSSIFGVIAPPGNVAYCASKFAVRGFSESLRHELQARRSPVRLSVVHPGGVRTDIVRHSQRGAHVQNTRERERVIDSFDRMARTSAEAAAHRIVRGIERNEPRVLIGTDARLMDWVQRLRPARYWELLEAIGRRLTRARP
ncbi:MAG TPA: SDR family oxidoreductase [Steroidobacteraceae bacterium]|jgi:short-subunit dehydrogenase|nr:SDR family oxidoreductase [Steroidobacteraceae bacterium]